MKVGLVGYTGSGKSTVFTWLTGVTPDIQVKAEDALDAAERLAAQRIQQDASHDTGGARVP